MGCKFIFYAFLLFFCIIGEALCSDCYHSTYGYSYCSGRCSGYYGSQHCIYYYGSYIFSGGAIAGLVLGLIAAAAIFIIILAICMKNYNRRHRTVGTVIGSTTTARTNIAVTNTTHTTGFIQTTNQYGYTVPPPQYSSVYLPPQASPSYPPPQGPPGYPPPQGPPGYPPPGQQGDNAPPALPEYNSIYKQPSAAYNVPPAN